MFSLSNGRQSIEFNQLKHLTTNDSVQRRKVTSEYHSQPFQFADDWNNLFFFSGEIIDNGNTTLTSDQGGYPYNLLGLMIYKYCQRRQQWTFGPLWFNVVPVTP